MTLSHLPLRLLLVVIVGMVVLLAPVPAASGSAQEKTVRIEASSYQFNPGVVRVNPGDQVTFMLSSTDVVHGLHIDGYDLEISADPGQTQSITFTAERSGSFRWRCSVTCGALHPFMIGKLVVGDNLMLWRAGGLATLAFLAGLFLVSNTAKRV